MQIKLRLNERLIWSIVFAVCGISIHDEVSTKISTGRVADPTAYPWHVVFRGIKVSGLSTFVSSYLHKFLIVVLIY